MVGEGEFQLDRRGVMHAGLAAGLIAATPAFGAMAGEPIVQLAEGKVRGFRRDEIYVFKGVAYGDTTAGPNRFGPPRPVKPWTGIRDAVEFGPAAPQGLLPTHMPLGPGKPSIAGMLGWGDDTKQSEDCLVLNVWTPGLRDGGKRPVMFRIHGGGFTTGSGAWPQSDGEAVARLGDVVVVTVNHRLGAPGYLYLGDIGGAAYADSGNAGMLDLIAALRWVRKNIAAFGGDPGNVMIFGESGGAAKVSTLLAMPGARGLFHRAIIESGATVKARSRAEATATTRKLLDKLGIKDNELDKLHSIPVSDMLVREAGLGGPVVDGRSLLQNQGDAIAGGSAAAVPVMIGNNQTEGTLLLHILELSKIAALDEAGMRTRLAAMVQDGHIDDVIAGYRKAYPNATPGDLFLYVEANWMFGVRSVEMAEHKLQGGGAPVYMYRFTWGGTALDGNLKASHGLEVPFTMHNPQTATALFETPGSQALVDRMSAAWIAFARSGKPDTRSLPHWPSYTTDTRATMIFNNECKVVNDPFGERDVWKFQKPPYF